MTPICCTGIPVTLPDGTLEYRCGHRYRVVFQLVEQPAPVEQKKPAAKVKVGRAAA